jgi:hypothetical protein
VGIHGGNCSDSHCSGMLIAISYIGFVSPHHLIFNVLKQMLMFIVCAFKDTQSLADGILILLFYPASLCLVAFLNSVGWN